MDILAEAVARGVRFCDLEFTDIVGMAKAVTIPLEQLPHSLSEGRWFDGSSLEGFARVTESDMYLRPDEATFTITPWDPTRARILCDVVQPNGELFAGDPRARLRHAIATATQHDLRYEVAPEIEFFLLHPDTSTIVPYDRGSYFDSIGESAAAFWRELMHNLEELHVPVESSHHEDADGQYEIDIALQEVLAAADSIMACKLAIKTTASRHHLLATFMPKPLVGINGSGMHLHQRMLALGTDRNAFADPNNTEYGLSTMGLHFIAGLLAHARPMSAILSPLINSYKRLVPTYEAPVEINWGHHNQDSLVRVPRLSTHRATDVLVEIRSPDPSCNPYLALTVLLTAGLDGIVHHRDCPPPSKEFRRRSSTTAPRRELHDYRLPETLAEALEALEASPLLNEALGPLIASEFLDAKWQEWESYRRHVSTWELERYLPLF